ncbi:glycosyltransferase [Holdemanella porci]|uniref:glycosyltransferase n=1 Tax=Holdemanella porci TaxID=2652276 RepID=UPI003F937526
MLYAILVIYNKSVLDSATYLFCKEHKDIQLIVCDNSTMDNENKMIVEKDGYHYISMHGNKGLSKAYNMAVDFLQNKQGYVMILDDDTILNEEYYHSIQNLTCDIALPIVKSQTSILSPCGMDHYVANGWDGKSEIKHISAINSGMVINLKLFKNYRYDENLFLDYVDHHFMMDMQNKNVQVLDCVIHQEFSAEEKTSLESCLNRFRIFKKDSKYFYRNHKLQYFFIVYKRAVRLIFQYKSLRFLFE